MPSPWRKTVVLENCWRCPCNRVVSNKLKQCDKCGHKKIKKEKAGYPRE